MGWLRKKLSFEYWRRVREEVFLKMKSFVVASICFFGVLSLSVGQFQSNGRILAPPEPELCAQRIIHERTPDGKGFVG